MWWGWLQSLNVPDCWWRTISATLLGRPVLIINHLSSFNWRARSHHKSQRHEQIKWIKRVYHNFGQSFSIISNPWRLMFLQSLQTIFRSRILKVICFPEKTYHSWKTVTRNPWRHRDQHRNGRESSIWSTPGCGRSPQSRWAGRRAGDEKDPQTLPEDDPGHHGRTGKKLKVKRFPKV